MNAMEIAVNLIALHDGELVGRTRLQKRAYLLHRCGAEFTLNFAYHHYGPYSFDLADGLTDARAEGLIEIEEKPGRYGIQYAIFRLKGDVDHPERLGKLPVSAARRLLKIMEQEPSDIVLEIAATIIFLRDEGGYACQPVEELKVRKPLKATEHRIDRARTLLSQLRLDTISSHDSEMRRHYANVGVQDTHGSEPP